MNSSTSKKYGELACDPGAWRKIARELMKAASLLEPAIAKFWEAQKASAPSDGGQIAVHFMLSAYALENLMKARLVELAVANGSLSPTLSRLPREIQGHDLIELAKSCGESALADEYSSILKRLSRAAVWYGRYPVPILPNDIISTTVLPSGELVSLTEYSSNDLHEIFHLLNEFALGDL